jgi:hypothetical protein
MYPIWTAHLQTEEEKLRFKNQLHGSREVFERLTQLVEQKENELGAAERNQSAYENPSWAYLQAHRNGYASAMKVIKNLLTSDQEKQ